MQLAEYAKLMRIDKPIGSLLLLWPTLTSLWIASDGTPKINLIVIFVLGTFIMRSAGCVINDYADRNFDGLVERTRTRPLATGTVSSREALILFISLCACGAILLLFLNNLTRILALFALFVAILYPFAKRWTQLPQGILGIAFSWGIPMAWTASTGSLTTIPWIFFSTCLVWIIAYDTLYAMVDKEDDELIGVKSSALLFGERTHFIVGFLQGITILGFCLLGWALDYGSLYLLGILGCVVLFIYQHKLISTKNRENYFKAFLNNNWVGLSLFAGTIMETTNWSIF